MRKKKAGFQAMAGILCVVAGILAGGTACAQETVCAQGKEGVQETVCTQEKARVDEAARVEKAGGVQGREGLKEAGGLNEVGGTKVVEGRSGGWKGEGGRGGKAGGGTGGAQGERSGGESGETAAGDGRESGQSGGGGRGESALNGGGDGSGGAGAAGGNDSIQAIRLLQVLQEKNYSVQSRAYHSYYRQVYNAVDDSIHTEEGRVWLSPRAADTIFGCVFHTRGSDEHGGYDYYYDGQKGLEIRHRDKAISVIDPYLFPNNENNPAKARTCLLTLQALFQKKDLVSWLITHNPYAKSPRVRLLSDDAEWTIILDYPKNDYGSVSTDTLFIDRKTGELVRTSRINYWNGTIYKATYRIEGMVCDDAASMDSLSLTDSYPGYTTTVYKRPGAAPADTMHWVGRAAPAFRLPTFDGKGFGGKVLSLTDLRGKYVLLDFWETWCGYCILAIPEMKDTYAKYHSKGVEIIGVTAENEQKIAGLIRDNALPYTHAKGNDKILKDYGVIGRPLYVLIGPDGKILVYRDWEEIKKTLEGI